MNDEAVLRTAPATPGLLKIYICFSLLSLYFYIKLVLGNLYHLVSLIGQSKQACVSKNIYIYIKTRPVHHLYQNLPDGTQPLDKNHPFGINNSILL